MVHPLRNNGLDNLRSFITLLVVIHHAGLSYTTFSVFNSDIYILSTHPVIDKLRAKWIDYLIQFNDLYFMQLIFFISGLFVYVSINKKGITIFLVDRIKRLLVPFLVIGTVAIWLSYIPAYLQTGKPFSLYAYTIDYFTTQSWPVGPPWFTWVLFLFTCLAILIYKKHIILKITKYYTLLNNNTAFYFKCFLLTIIAYIPLVHIVDPYKWVGWGPFDFQLSRILLYFTYFIIGVWTGKLNAEHRTVPLFAKVPYWFVLVIVVLVAINSTSEALFLVTISWLMLRILIPFFQNKVAINSIAIQSFNKSAYLIFLIHYPVVTWIQYLLLDYTISPTFKFIITSLASTLISWLIAIFIKRNKTAAMYL